MPLLRPCFAHGSALGTPRARLYTVPCPPAHGGDKGARRCLATKPHAETPSPSLSPSPSTAQHPPEPGPQSDIATSYRSTIDTAKRRYTAGVTQLRKAYQDVARLPSHAEQPALQPVTVELARYLQQVAEDAGREDDTRILRIVGRRWRKKVESQSKVQRGKNRPAEHSATQMGTAANKISAVKADTANATPVGQAARQGSVKQLRPTKAIPTPSTKPTCPTIQQRPSTSTKTSEQTLLEELFPEVNAYVESRQTTKTYPKLNLPDPGTNQPIRLITPARSSKERLVEAFQKKGEQITALQLVNCSTELTEADFRRLIPRGRHIDAWIRDGEFSKIIPGRDPLSLERLPFYYLLFKTPESALAYQKNASRLHKLSGLHQNSDIFSAIPLPNGFVEDGEDINAAVSSYLLLPSNHELRLTTVMQPYNPMLRSLIENGGYKPIVPEVDSNGKCIYKVRMHIEGYEPTANELWLAFWRHAREHGMTWPFHNDSVSAIRRLRDIVNLKTKFQSISTANPRATSTFAESKSMDFEDAAISMHYASSDPDEDPTKTNQLIMNRMYNRWIVEFEEEDAARRFATMWHRKLLPDVLKYGQSAAWRDAEEPRICNCEFLW